MGTCKEMLAVAHASLCMFKVTDKSLQLSSSVCFLIKSLSKITLSIIFQNQSA